MKFKLLNLLLILSSLLGYLEWGGGNHILLVQAEAEIVNKLFTDPRSVLHPFILFPMAAQVILLFTLFQNKTNKKWTYISIAGLGLLLGFMFIIGWMILNFKIILSTVPFLVIALLTIREYRQTSKIGE